MIKVIRSDDNILLNTCEDCKKESESVSKNLILYGYKICESCRISKTIFPVQPVGPKILNNIIKTIA